MSHKYLTDAGKKLLEEQLLKSHKVLDKLLDKPPGTYAWRMMRRYIDGLEFLIDMENR